MLLCRSRFEYSDYNSTRDTLPVLFLRVVSVKNTRPPGRSAWAGRHGWRNSSPQQSPSSPSSPFLRRHRRTPPGLGRAGDGGGGESPASAALGRPGGALRVVPCRRAWMSGGGPGWWRRHRLGGERCARVLATHLGCTGGGRSGGCRGGCFVGRPSDLEVVVLPRLNLASLLPDPERSASGCQIRAGGRMLHQSCGLIETERKLWLALSCPTTATPIDAVVLLGGVVVVSIPPPWS
jgi:hypothetical protein